MGRKKLEIKRIESTSRRLVTFSKRRNGLIKKAREISVLCDAEVALIILSARGRRFEFCSSTSLSKVIERYLKQLEKEPGKHRCANAKYNQESPPTLEQLQEKFQCQLKQSSIDQLSITELVQLEMRLDAALHRIRLRKTQMVMDSISALKDKERSLILQNELLGREILASEKNGGNSGRMAVEFL